MFGTFDNYGIFMELIPFIYEMTPVYKVTDAKFILKLMLNYPWPLRDTELIADFMGVMDYNNKGILLVSKMMPVGENYFNYKTP